MLVSLLLSPAFAADEKPAPPAVKVGGVIYAHYGYDLTEGADGYNEFAVDRTYLDVRATMGEQLGTRLTLDSDKLKIVDSDGEPADTKYRLFVKYAFLEWKTPAGVKVRGGMVDTPYVPYYDGFAGIRYIGKHIADESKLLDTSDLGVAASGEHAEGLFGWQVGLYNGEGYGKNEDDGGKTVQARVTVDPLSKGELSLPVSAFFSYGGQPADDTSSIVYGGAVGFKAPYLVFWGDYLGASEGGVSGSEISVTAIPRVPDVLGVIGRFDLVDPDAATDDDGTSRLTAGLARNFYSKGSSFGERSGRRAGDPRAPTTVRRPDLPQVDLGRAIAGVGGCYLF